MNAEVRRSGGRSWTVCIACRLEQAHSDFVDAVVHAEEHDEAEHPVVRDERPSRVGDLDLDREVA